MKNLIKNTMKRRSFLTNATKLALAIPALQILSLFRISSARAENKPQLAESDPFAKSIHYCADAEKASKAKTSACPTRKEKDRAGQFCRGCQFYTKESGEGASETGKCLIVQGKSVTGGGWCMSWAKKQA